MITLQQWIFLNSTDGTTPIVTINTSQYTQHTFTADYNGLIIILVKLVLSN